MTSSRFVYVYAYAHARDLQRDMSCDSNYLCAGFGGKTHLCTCSGLFFQAPVHVQPRQIMGDLPDLTNGAIQVSLILKSAVSHRSV